MTAPSLLGTTRKLTGEQIRDRIRVMFGQVYKSFYWPVTRTLATQMVLQAGCPTQQLQDIDRVEIDKCQIAAIFWAVKNQGYYLGDVYNIDTYSTMQRTASLSMPSVLATAIPQFRAQVREAYKRDLQALLNGEGTLVYDCDDAVIVYCSLLGSIGFRVGAKCISTDGKMFSHTYAVVEIPRYVEGAKQIVTLDATEYEAYPGWEPPAQYRRLERIFWYGA